MSQRSETFGRLLRGAMNSIAAYEGKTAPVVEDELGTQIGLAGSTFQRYLGRAWLQPFLQAARHPNAVLLIERLVGAPPALPAPGAGLPAGTLTFLFHRYCRQHAHLGAAPGAYAARPRPPRLSDAELVAGAVATALDFTPPSDQAADDYRPLRLDRLPAVAQHLGIAVTLGNEPARRVYEALGFEMYLTYGVAYLDGAFPGTINYRVGLAER